MINEDMDTVIYFVLAPEVKRVKIGITNDIDNRMSQLKTSSPVDLFLIKTIKGDRHTEKLLHKKFAHLHFKGEWFKYTRYIENYIANYNLNLNNISKKTIKVDSKIL